MKDPSQHVSKKARKAKDAEEYPVEEWAEAEYEHEAMSVAPAEASAEPSMEDFEPGAVVLYWKDWRGVIRDAFEAIDEFWVADEESGKIVCNEDGDVVNFKSSELELVARPPIAPPNPKQRLPPGGVILVGDEHQMRKMINHFGTPDTEVRHQPQMLLAFPCGAELQPDKLLEQATESGVTDDVKKLAKELRPDIHVAVRAYHLKKAVNDLGSDLFRMDGFFLMASVTLPYGWEEGGIGDVKGWKKKWRRDVCNQIDLGPTARGLSEVEDNTPEDTARRALGQEVGVVVSLVLWDEQVQRNLRQSLDLDLPLQYADVNDGRITVLLLPSDASAHIEDGMLCFTEAPDADYLAEGVSVTGEDAGAERADEVAGGITSDVKEVDAKSKHGGKTIAQWEKEQAQFADEPKIPPDWVRVVSQKTGDVYFFNKKTQKATFELPVCPEPELPLPAGWNKQVSKSTGKTYYWHAGRRESRFERPLE